MKMNSPWYVLAMCGLVCVTLSTTQSQPASSLQLRRTPVVEVFDRCKDAVVNISSTQVIAVRSPMGLDNLFEQLFDLPSQPRMREYRATSVGSGFVIHPEGYIVTNAHVVARTAERKAIFSDNREYDAQIVAVDSDHDLAILKIQADRPLNAIQLGRSHDLMVGETVIAIGNPLGYQHTVTSGVVSALNRQLDVAQGVSFRGLIQTDASINPGNSGGPLLNVLGELIGINTAIRGDAQNIGFAIAVDQLRELLPELLDVERRYRFTTGLKVGIDNQPVITLVTEDSPAARAGLRVGDVIQQINTQIVRSGLDYHIALVGHVAGDQLTFTFQRGQTSMRTNLTLDERPRPDGLALLRSKFGITVEPLSERLARSLRLARGTGLLVTKVDSGSTADQIELKRNDIIIQLGPHQVTAIDELGELLERLKPGQTTRIAILRVQGNTIFRLTAPIIAR